MNHPPPPSPLLAHKLILQQFPQYSHLPIHDVEKQGHDNRTYRLGDHLLIRMPTGPDYALKIPIEQKLLQELAPFLSVHIPVPIHIGSPSQDYPFPFSIYKWLPGTSLNLLTLNSEEKNLLAANLAKFLKELHSIKNVEGPKPGQHNFWRGGHPSVYDKDARQQITELASLIDSHKALNLWNQACSSTWNNPPVWIHGDFAIGNMLIQNKKLSAIIDFGCAAIGDPACDLVIAWTYFSHTSRQIFINEINLDPHTWLRAQAWALWKATFELSQIKDKNSPNALTQISIIQNLLANSP